MSEKVQIFSLRQVVSSIRKTIEERYQSEYWVKAEMHKLGMTRSGHCYPELLEKENGKIVAEMRGILWKHNFDSINANFVRVVKEPLKEDTTLLMKVKVNFHEIYGMSLHILDIDPNYALGELHKERAETLKKLKEEKLLNANQQLPFPLLPKRVAIISADSSKGLSDFMKVIDENQWGYTFFTMLFPAYLQGDQAASSIAIQLDRIKKVRQHFDVVVIVRGGGGEVGLSCYNNFELCKAIASFPLPVLTGIGHSTNLTVAELVAYRNAITPTELADFLLQAFHNFSVPIQDAQKVIKRSAFEILKDAKYELSKYSVHCQSVTKNRLHNESYGLQKSFHQVNKAVQHLIADQRSWLRNALSNIDGSSKYVLRTSVNEVDRTANELDKLAHLQLERTAQKIERLETKIKYLDPQNVLDRGYSITLHNQKLITKENPVQEGDEIETIFAHTKLHSKIIRHDE